MAQHREQNQKSKKLRQHKMLSMILIAFGIACGITSALMLVLYRKPHVEIVSDQPAISDTKPKPEEVAQYKVAADLPKFIEIPAIGVKQVRIMHLGTTKDFKVAAPSNIFDAGWYKSSAKPGASGAAFIYGHLSSDSTHGAFYDLKKLKPGDIVSITRGDNSVLTYKVKSLETYSVEAVPMEKVLAPIVAGEQGINLMTCAGDIIKDTGEFTQRFVVYTAREK